MTSTSPTKPNLFGVRLAGKKYTLVSKENFGDRFGPGYFAIAEEEKTDDERGE